MDCRQSISNQSTQDTNAASYYYYNLVCPGFLLTVELTFKQCTNDLTAILWFIPGLQKQTVPDTIKQADRN